MLPLTAQTSMLDKYKPKALADIIGQPCIYRLMALAAAPRRSCWLLEGNPGVGKSCAAHLLAEELGCTMLSKHVYKANAVDVKTADRLFNETLRCRPMDGAPVSIVIIEEFERCVSNEVRVFLKGALDIDVDPDDGGLPRRTVVLATSNNIDAIEPALLERFIVLRFDSGPAFAMACQERIAQIWAAETTAKLPREWKTWGWYGDQFSMRFSMRAAMRKLEEHLELLSLVA